MPYFFTAGIVARGFIPSRPTDTAGFGVVYGDFSSDLRHAQEREQLLDPATDAQNYESVLEWTYRMYFRKSAAFFQPDTQYVLRPGGTGKLTMLWSSVVKSGSISERKTHERIDSCKPKYRPGFGLV